MRRAAAILVLGLAAAGCAGATGGPITTSPEETTTTAPAWALDFSAPAGNTADPDGQGQAQGGPESHWRATAGGPIDASYLDDEACGGWASRAPVVEYNLPSGGGDLAFSFSPDVPVAPVGGPGGELVGDVPQGLVLIVRGPHGAWACSGDYQGWEYSPSITVEFPSAQPGTYDVWLAAEHGESANGDLVIVAPGAPPPTTTTPGATGETPATTFPAATD